MKGKNKILIGCLALLLVLSVGYALFSDTITINGTATAKGNFELTMTCDENVDEALGSNGPAEKGSVTDAKITCENNVVNVSATLGYPGSHKWFRIMVKNTGTIPAKLKQITELNNPVFMNGNKDSTASGMEYCKEDSSNMVCVYLLHGVNWVDDYDINKKDEVQRNEWAGMYAEEFDAVLDPNETAYFYVWMSWLKGDTSPEKPIVAEGKFEITWEQVTVE